MLDVPAVPGSYEATLSGDGGKLTGTWTQGKSLPLEITRDTKSASQETAPAPAAAPVPLSDLKPVLDKEFAPVIAAWPERGVVVGVLDHGRQEVFAYGSAKPDSLFEIGSITKTFTGLALAQMVTQHQITLDEPVRELLPAGIVTKPAGPEITLLDLATQHSGLPRLPDNFKPSDPGDPYSDYTARKLYELLAKRGVGRPEKTEFLYSNLGFGLLGQALAEKARMPYAKLIRTQVTGPLGLNDTAVALSTQQQSRLIQGYSGAHDAVRVWNLDAIAGAGALRSTAADLLTYAEAHLHPEKLPAANAGPVSTIAEAIRLDHQPRSDAPGGMKIALAWLIRPEQNIYWHNGGTGGYSSMLIFEPGRDRAIVILHNCEDMTPGKPQLVDRVAANITALLDGKPVPPIGD
jgi:CubicO group peptidase (beta-lactamase class C family)